MAGLNAWLMGTSCERRKIARAAVLSQARRAVALDEQGSRHAFRLRARERQATAQSAILASGASNHRLREQPSKIADESVGKPDSVRSLPTVAIIHLRPLLPAAWCDLPGGSGEQPSSASADARTRPFDLAPGGVYRAIPVTWDAGGLLHRRFTLTSVSMKMPGISSVG